MSILASISDDGDNATHCFRGDHNWARAVNYARHKAYEKHGNDSIAKLNADDPRWLAILVEEIGEVANALTYDSVGDLPHELLDVLAVASGWLLALSRADSGQ